MEIPGPLKYADCEQEAVPDVPWILKVFTCFYDVYVSIGGL